MRLEVSCSDRLGISQEILSILASQQWNIVAMEVVPHSICLNIDAAGADFKFVSSALLHVDGVTNCQLIDLLPTESREQHLNAMLSRIPDPIFDIDAYGTVLSSNLKHRGIHHEASSISPSDDEGYIGLNVTHLLNVELNKILSRQPNSLEVNFNGRLYIAETTPVIAAGKFNGVVLILKGMATIGRQMSLLQQGSAHHIDNILGSSDKITILKNQLIKFSTLDLPILITGETGTGKELFARAIHEASGRKEAPFLAINCASLSEHLLESELFGYVAGAFTGAQKSGKPGLFELAHGGTVFLDEIAEMSGYLQAKLLRFLQDYSYRRLGGTKELTANVRIISASHQPFDQMIKDKLFREDLYYRLNVLTLALPALRARKTDIPILCTHFLENAAKQVNIQRATIDEEALQLLNKYSWPGNIRQLQNVLFRLVALSSHGDIGKNDVKRVLAEFVKTDISNTRLRVNDELISSGEHKNWLDVEDWRSAQQLFEQELLSQFKPVYPTTRKLAERLKVSHNKVAMKLREYNL